VTKKTKEAAALGAAAARAGDDASAAPAGASS
ncbi:MAG: hypothetical protein QOF60_394, partial [Actinomycetota bacterium]|jgi:hypothetical protein|nr:hypothetical protein [Actinomycetota bacterium]